MQQRYITVLDGLEYTTTSNAYINGKRIPRVTQVLQPLSQRLYNGVRQDILDNAAQYGNHLHSAIQYYLDGSLDEQTLDSPLKNSVDQFRQWLKEKFPEEKPVNGTPIADCILKYTGCCDVLIPDKALIEIKTRSIIPYLDILQIAAYAQLYVQLKKIQYIVVELKPHNMLKAHGIPFRLIKHQAWPLFKKMLDYWYKTEEINVLLETWRNA